MMKKTIFGILLLMLAMCFAGCNLQKTTNEESAPDPTLETHGGTLVYYEMILEEGMDEEQVFDECVEVFRDRLDSLGYTYADFQRNGNVIIIEIPCLYDDITETIRQVGREGKLQFVNHMTGEVYFEGNLVESATASYGATNVGASPNYVTLVFTDKGTELFGKATEEVAKQGEGNNFLDITLDGVVISHASVESPIYDSSCIISSPDFTEESAQELASLIDAGSLPVRIEEELVTAVAPPADIQEKLKEKAKEEFKNIVAAALDKDVKRLTDKDFLDIKYVEIANDGETLQIYFGYDDYFTRLDEYMAEQEAIAAAQEESDAKLEEMRLAAAQAAKAEAEAAGNEFDEEAFNEAFYAEEHDTGIAVPEATVIHPVELAKTAVIDSTSELMDLNCIQFFKNAKTVNLTGAKIDVDTIVSLKNTTEFNFVACEFDNFAALKDVDFSKIERFSIDISMVPIVKVVGEDGYETEVIDEEVLEMLKPYGDKVFLAQYLLMNTGNGYIRYPYGEISIAEYFPDDFLD